MYASLLRRMRRVCAAVVAVLVLAGASGDRPVRVGLAFQPNTLDPLVSSQYIENYIEEAIFSGLTILDDRGNVLPDLATVVPTRANGGISADAKTIVYHLRRNVRWQDGVPFTSRDVTFTFAKMRDPSVPFAVLNWYAIVDRVDAPDPYTVVVRLRKPAIDAPAQLFVNGQFGMILPEHLLRGVADLRTAAFNTQPVGTGPYAVVRWDRGSSIDLRANPSYFGGAPHIGALHISFVSDQNTLAIEKRTGELDFVEQLPLAQVRSFVDSPAMTVRLVPSYELDYVVVNLQAAPFDDLRLRRALSLAIDRRAIAAKPYHGAALPADSLYPPWSRDVAGEPTTVPAADPVRARALLDAAGWKLGPDGIRVRDGKRLAFTLTTLAGQQEILAMWRGIGVDVALRPLQSTVVFAPVDGILASGRFTAAFIYYGELPMPDRTDNLASFAWPPHGNNYSRFGDRDVDGWLERSHAVDGAARRALVTQIASRVRSEVPLMPVVWQKLLYSWDGNLTGVRPETVNSDFWNVAEWNWRVR
jgi:peptide/nickel transport system substrate-binding protein